MQVSKRYIPDIDKVVAPSIWDVMPEDIIHLGQLVLYVAQIREHNRADVNNRHYFCREASIIYGNDDYCRYCPLRSDKKGLACVGSIFHICK